MTGLDQIWFTPLRKWTTRAGFGCATLMGARSRKESLALLAAAWDSGIRYFDVAPLYGHGEAERVLGSFLQGRRGDVTLVTKFGLKPTESSRLREVARTVLRPLVRTFPTLRRSAAKRPTVVPAPPRFDPGEVRRSIEQSLRALRTDYIDTLLLHEASAEALTDDRLLYCLEQAVQHGLIRSFGVGGEASHVPDLYRDRIRYCPVLQFDWCLLDGPPPRLPGCQTVINGSISKLRHASSFQRLTDAWSSVNGATSVASGKSGWAPILLRAAALSTPEAVILFSSTNPSHVTASAQAICNASLDVTCWNLLAALKAAPVRSTSSPVFNPNQTQSVPFC